MTTSAIDRELIYYFMQLDDQQKRSLLEMIKTFLKPADKQPSGINIEEYSNELLKAEAGYERGEYILQEEMLKQIDKWEKNMK